VLIGLNPQTMQHLIILKGLPASGKTTWAREWVDRDPTERMRVNKDDLRNMVGNYQLQIKNPVIGKMQEEIIRKCLTYGKSVVVDNTNLFEDFSAFALDFPKVNIQVLDLAVPTHECIRRDRLRENPVGDSVILDMAIASGVLEKELQPQINGSYITIDTVTYNEFRFEEAMVAHTLKKVNNEDYNIT
jgi:predicted kinase